MQHSLYLHYSYYVKNEIALLRSYALITDCGKLMTTKAIQKQTARIYSYYLPISLNELTTSFITDSYSGCFSGDVQHST